VLVDTAEPSWIIERFQQWGCSSTHISILKMWIPFFQQYNTDEKAKRLIDFARTHAPDDPYLSAQHLYYAVNDLPEFERTLNALIELSPEDAFDIGVELHETNRDSWAAKIFERIVERYPTQATVWVYLARCYQKMGNTKLADEAMNHARELDPRNSLLLETDAL
jgi:predicted Zn-dependent protease